MNTQMNGAKSANGAGGEAQRISINPQEVGRLALMFLARCDLKPAEREAFAHVELLVQAIANGTVQLVQGPNAATIPIDQPTQQ